MQPSTIMYVSGEEVNVPLRWNNPHAAEMEVNIWIFHYADADKKPIVVPILNPSCSAEGHQDNMVSFTVPKDFKNLGDVIPGFNRCNAGRWLAGLLACWLAGLLAGCWLAANQIRATEYKQ